MIWVWLCHLSPRTRRLALIWTKWAPCLAAVIFIAVSAAEAWSRLDLITTPHPSPLCESRLAKLNRARSWASHTLPCSAPPRPSAQPTYTWPYCQTALDSLFVSFSLALCEFFFFLSLADTFRRNINWFFFYCCSCYPKACCSIFKVLWWFIYKGPLRTHAHTCSRKLMPGALVALRDAQLDWQKRCLLFSDWHTLAYELGNRGGEGFAAELNPSQIHFVVLSFRHGTFHAFVRTSFCVCSLWSINSSRNSLKKVKRLGLLPNSKMLFFRIAVRAPPTHPHNNKATSFLLMLQ